MIRSKLLIKIIDHTCCMGLHKKTADKILWKNEQKDYHNTALIARE